MSFIALVDCNNFYVSCERVFNPKLCRRPVIVLSNNDGCIIARSQEAKKLGIPMGAPFFKWADFLRAHDVVICSSNYALYGDMSHRVMETLAHFNPDLEIYSIDEAFLSIEKDPFPHCRHIRQKILQWTGIPVSIGIAPTKTLAKIANHTAKRTPSLKGVFMPSKGDFETILDRLPVGEIWGIGKRLALRLAKRGMHTAAQLRDQEDGVVRNMLSVVGLRTVWELRGVPSLPLNEAPATKQTIMTSRSFGRPILMKSELKEAIARFAARGGEKMREEGSLASWLQVFVTTSPHKEEAYYSNQAYLVLSEPTDYTPALIDYAHRALEAIFRSGHAYKKAGVLLGGLVPHNVYQQDLFVRENSAQKKSAMALLDRANKKFNHSILHYVAEGTAKGKGRFWQMRRSLCSPCYTTQWKELLTISIN